MHTWIHAMTHGREVTLAGIVLTAGALSGVPRFTWAQPDTRADNGVRITRDIAYREGNDAWTLDLYQPEDRGETPRPGLVWIHGGGWMYGDKGGAAGMLTRYARKGYVGISVRYRLTGDASFPACVQDVRCAVRWFRAHAEELHVDPTRIAGFGHSAGAHLVAFLGVAGPDPELDAGPYLDQSSLLNAVCSVATPTDFTHWHRPVHQQQSLVRLLVNAGPDAMLMERARKASPITYVSAAAPPYLLIHGTADGTVDVSQAQRFARALQEAGAEDASLLIISQTGHSPHATHGHLVNPLMDAFFESTVGPGRDIARAARERFAEQQERRRRIGASYAQLRDRYDRNGDGTVTREEFTEGPGLFFRLDRDEDGILTAADFAQP